MVTCMRPMVEADVEAVHAIELETNPLPWKPDDFRAFLPDLASGHGEDGGQRKQAWVCADPVAIGFACASGVADEAELQSLAVEKRHWGQGIGAALLQKVCDWARECGYRKLHLEVREGNARAVRLYRRLGFEPSGRRPRYYQDSGEDALLMSKPV